MKRVTLKDLAQKANVSVNTVSRALSDKSDIGKPTKEKIRRIAREMNYRPNVLARSLRTKKTKTIGVVISDNSNPFFAKILKGIQDATNGKGYQIILCNTEEKYEKEWEAIQLLIDLRMAGLLITPTQINAEGLMQLGRLRIPFVLLCRKMENPSANYVVCNDMQGGYLATRHLIQQGHHRIAMLSGLAGTSDARERLEGCKQAMTESGIPLDPALVQMGCFNPETGYAGMKQILMAAERPTAVFCFSDYVAMGAIDAIEEQQLKIPGDIAVVGFDDIEFASHLRVPLTTVKTPQYTLGVKATELLLGVIEGDIDDTQQIVLTPELVRRASG